MYNGCTFVIKTQEEYSFVMNLLEKEGFIWYSGAMPTKLNYFVEGYPIEIIVDEECNMISKSKHYDDWLDDEDYVYLKKITKKSNSYKYSKKRGGFKLEGTRKYLLY